MRKCMFIVMTIGSLIVQVAAAQVVRSDDQLVAVARDTYQRGDYVYAAIHLGALLQRNPSVLRMDSALAKEVNDALVYSIQQLQADHANASRCVARTNAGAGASGAAVQGLSSPPPRVNWPSNIPR